MIRIWHKEFPNGIYRYNPPSKTEYTRRAKISGNLSYATNFLLNVFCNTIPQKNLIIIYNSSLLKPLSLLSLIYMRLFEKNVYVLSSKLGSLSDIPVDYHIRNYTLLLDSKNHYFFMSYPSGSIKDDRIKAEIFTSWMTRSYKPKYIDYITKQLLEKKCSKLLFDNSEEQSRIINNIKKLEVEQKTINKDLIFDIGLFIFENVDRFMPTHYNYKKFVDWLSDYSAKDQRFLFHFSNSESKFIKLLKQQYNCLVVPFSRNFLSTNRVLRENSLHYFDKLKNNDLDPLIKFYNIDSENDYHFIENLTIIDPPLPSGNIDVYCKKIDILRKHVNEDRIINKASYYSLLKLSSLLPNLILNPSKFKKVHYIDENTPLYCSIPQFFQVLNESIENELDENKLFLKLILDYTYNLYEELQKTHRLDENTGFLRVSKETKLRNLVSNYGSRNLIIACNSSYERNRIREYFEDFKNIKVFTIEEINISIFERISYTLILPGPLRFCYISELLQPYQEIIFLAYDGLNKSLIRKQIALISDYALSKEKQSIEYLQEIFDLLGEYDKGLLSTFYERDIKQKEILYKTKSQLVQSKIAENRSLISNLETLTEDFEDYTIENIINQIIKSNEEYDELYYYEKEQEIIEKREIEIKNEYEKKLSSSREEIKYRIQIKKDGTSEVIVKNLDVDRTFLTIDDKRGIISEVTPKNLQPGNLIVILDGDERKTLLEIMLETYNFEESIDKELVEYWKNKLNEFIEYNEISYSEFYDIYKKIGGTKLKQTVNQWLKGERIGPQDADDLLIIGKITNDPIIKDDYYIMFKEIEKLRTVHRQVGKFLKKIVSYIIKQEIVGKEWSFEETILYDKISKGLYRLISIERSKQ